MKPLRFSSPLLSAGCLGMAIMVTNHLIAGELAEPPRGGRVGWARLITSEARWNLHSDQDPKLAAFIRSETSLNIDPTWYSVDPVDLEKLCAYPFVYVKDLTRVRGPKAVDNLAEYLRRGGFIFVDPCTTSFSASDLARFKRQHTELFARLSPGCNVRELPDTHELYRCYFTVTVDDIFSADMIRAGATKPPSLGTLGVFAGERLMAVISTSGLECGWPQTPGRTAGCMKFIVNSYIYAMTR
ncbi:MAG TPA: DUF4159 domain-containing protein [Lacunisphaera sp.]|nr:DUF4159 domain-containing protein [Lacunisphaera sp.]